MPAWKIHDGFNLGALALTSVLTLVSLCSARAHRPLASFFMFYIVVDTIWIAAMPAVVKAPLTLLVHHSLASLLLLHALTHAPHTRYIAWMYVSMLCLASITLAVICCSCANTPWRLCCRTIVEINTFFMVLRRHLKRAWVECAFLVSWWSIRVGWFPYLPFHWFLFIQEPWPVAARYRRLVVGGGTSVLAIMQLFWTQQAAALLLRQRRGLDKHWL